MKQIALTQGKVALVSDEDFGKLNQYKWLYNKYGYAARHEYPKDRPRKYIVMHRQIMATPKGMDTDHINHDRLDNRRENLRVCTRSQNSINSTRKLKGATLVKTTGKWMSRITIDGKTKFLGYFNTQELAMKEYDKFAELHHGEFARLNYGR